MNADGPRPGLRSARGSIVTTVSEADTAASLGSGDLPVLGTPRLVALMEAASLNALADELDSRLTTVGVHLDVRHSAPTAVGAEVRVEASVSDIEGRRISFEVAASSGGQEIGRGRHVRVVVDRDEFLARVTHP